MPEPTWEEVEAFLVGSQVVAGLRAKMGGDPVPAEIDRALDAALAKVRDSFRGEARRIIAAATAALDASKGEG